MVCILLPFCSDKTFREKERHREKETEIEVETARVYRVPRYLPHT